MRRILLFILFFALTFFILSTTFADAAPKPKKAAPGPSISVGATYNKIKNVVLANFGGLKGVSKVSYTLMYQGNGIGQGVMGSFSPGKKTSYATNLYLGTCSGKVCTKHKNVKNIKLEVTTKFTNGKSSTKTYNVK